MNRTILPLLALAVLAAGCKKSGFWSPTQGEQIRFRVVSNSASDSESKTAYSGEYFTVTEGGYSGKYERIDWVTGDDITVAYISYTDGTDFLVNADAYVVDEIKNPSQQVAFAGIRPKYGNGLKWTDRENHEFYACYPDVSSDEDFAFELSAGGITAAVPFDFPQAQQLTRSESDENVFLPDMAHAPMLSGSGGAISTEGDVSLTFDPHFTAFEFQVTAKEGDSFTVNSFTLTSENHNITGRFIWTMVDPANGTWKDVEKEGAVHNTATVDFAALNNDEPIALNDSKTITFTVIVCCPEKVEADPEHSDPSNYNLNDLTITFNINKDGEPVNRSLKLANSGGNYLSFYHNRKHRITGIAVPLNLPVYGWFEMPSDSDAGGYTNEDWD